MNTRILGISGSPRKSATRFCVEEALESASAVPGIETDFIDLQGAAIHYCIHCDQCVREGKGRCPVFNDDMNRYYERFLKADGYIIGSPVYNMNTTALLQLFLNRLRPLGVFAPEGDRQRKIGGAIAISGMRNGGAEMALQAINNFYLSSGILVISGGVFAYNGAAVWSNDRKTQGAREDEQGMKSVRLMGRRIAIFADLIRRGINGSEPPLSPSHIIGFETQEEFDSAYGRFRGRSKERD
jgi:multimeric flavodoxin WrbA